MQNTDIGFLENPSEVARTLDKYFSLQCYISFTYDHKFNLQVNFTSHKITTHK